MKRLTVSIDDKLAKTLADYASCAGCSQASVVRGVLLALEPTLDSSVSVYRRAQDCGVQTKQVLQRAAEKMGTDILPRQQAFVREWNAMLANLSEDIDKAATRDGNSQSSNF